jgi:hypothetical protein
VLFYTHLNFNVASPYLEFPSFLYESLDAVERHSKFNYLSYIKRAEDRLLLRWGLYCFTKPLCRSLTGFRHYVFVPRRGRDKNIERLQLHKNPVSEACLLVRMISVTAILIESPYLTIALERILHIVLVALNALTLLNISSSLAVVID